MAAFSPRRPARAPHAGAGGARRGAGAASCTGILKPSNVFVELPSRRVKLLDFGIAKLLDADKEAGADRRRRDHRLAAVHGARAALRAPGRSAHRRLRRRRHALRVPGGARAVRGRRRHRGAAHAPRGRAGSARSPPARSVRSGDVALRCLQKAPAERFASAAELALALEEAVAAAPDAEAIAPTPPAPTVMTRGEAAGSSAPAAATLPMISPDGYERDRSSRAAAWARDPRARPRLGRTVAIKELLPGARATQRRRASCARRWSPRASSTPASSRSTRPGAGPTASRSTP